MASKKASTPKLNQPHTGWTGVISFGMIPVPCKLHTGTRSRSAISFNQVHQCADGTIAKTNQLNKCPHCETLLTRGELLKGVPKPDGGFVLITKDDIDACKLPTDSEIVIEKFVKLAEIDPMLFESNYFLSPNTGGERGWNLMRLALLKGGYAAIGRVAMYQREHVLVIRPFENGLMAHTLFYETEVPEMEYPAAQEPSEVELEIAGQLMAAQIGQFDLSEYHDNYADAAQQMVAQKLAGNVVEMPTAAPAKAEVGGDLLAALRASVAAIEAKKQAVATQPIAAVADVAAAEAIIASQMVGAA